jgi:hypothetical protein
METVTKAQKPVMMPMYHADKDKPTHAQGLGYFPGSGSFHSGMDAQQGWKELPQRFEFSRVR